MTINLVTEFAPYVDEKFSAESKKSLLTNNDFDWSGAHTIKVYKVSTASMGDYDRAGTGANASRYGKLQSLDATTEELTLGKDRSFTFAIDKLDEDETKRQLQAASALARQQREVIIPEVDAYTYAVMFGHAGTTAVAAAITSDNVYGLVCDGTETLDDALVPETGRVLIVTPAVYRALKTAAEFDSTEIGAEMKTKGVVAFLDGMAVIKVPAALLPKGFGFMICHPCATVAPVKLEDYKIHQDAPGISGSLVEGRVCYDAFVLENKADAIYVQPIPSA